MDATWLEPPANRATTAVSGPGTRFSARGFVVTRRPSQQCGEPKILAHFSLRRPKPKSQHTTGRDAHATPVRICRTLLRIATGTRAASVHWLVFSSVTSIAAAPVAATTCLPRHAPREGANKPRRSQVGGCQPQRQGRTRLGGSPDKREIAPGRQRGGIPAPRGHKCVGRRRGAAHRPRGDKPGGKALLDPVRCAEI